MTRSMRLTCAVAGLCTLLPLTAYAEVLSSSGRARLFSSQTRVLDSRAAQQYNSSVQLQPPRVETPTKWGDAATAPAYAGRYRGELLPVARQAARRHGIPEDLFLRLVQQESGWNPRARSHKGALGLAQLMPATARALRVDPHDPEQIRRQSFEYLGITTPDRAMWNLRNVLREIGEDQEQRIFDALKSSSDADASLGGLERLLCGSLGFPEQVLDPDRLERLIKILGAGEPMASRVPDIIDVKRRLISHLRGGRKPLGELERLKRKVVIIADDLTSRSGKTMVRKLEGPVFVAAD